MKLQRRRFLHLALGAATLSVLPRAGSALDYPARPVRIVVPYPAGIAPDIIARLVAQSLSQRLKQQFIVEPAWRRQQYRHGDCRPRST
jgi:tripartite-type tricarboxylate transporter receptor subunit TctC